MNDKSFYNNFLNEKKEEIIVKKSQINEINSEITINYKIDKNDSKINLFGYYFVKNNERKCKILCEDKIYNLCEYFDLTNFDKNKNILKIKLIGINNITNMSKMFLGCKNLLSFPDISKWKTNNVTNMSFMFSCCGTLSFLPDISNWNTEKVTDMSSMFSGCWSLATLPDISKWSTNNVKDMSFMFYECQIIIKIT